MPKGFKTISVTDDCWKFAKALFFEKGKQHESFSRWLSDFIIKSVKKQVWNNFASSSLVIIGSDKKEITLADKISKKIVSLEFAEGVGIVCNSCETTECSHVSFIERSLIEIDLLEKEESEIYSNVIGEFLAINEAGQKELTEESFATTTGVSNASKFRRGTTIRAKKIKHSTNQYNGLKHKNNQEITK